MMHCDKAHGAPAWGTKMKYQDGVHLDMEMTGHWDRGLGRDPGTGHGDHGRDTRVGHSRDEAHWHGVLGWAPVSRLGCGWLLSLVAGCGGARCGPAARPVPPPRGRAPRAERWAGPGLAWPIPAGPGGPTADLGRAAEPPGLTAGWRRCHRRCWPGPSCPAPACYRGASAQRPRALPSSAGPRGLSGSGPGPIGRYKYPASD